MSFDHRERDRRKELEGRKWAYKTVEAEPKLQETINTLSWIARQLQVNNTVDLLIEKMQPSWIESERWNWYYGFLLGGSLACMQHLSLRIVLWQSGTIPWNFAQFLNYCVERRLLLRVGGRYRFLHRELLHYFAQCDSNVRK